MSDKPISQLRQRMIDDMTARRFSEATQKDYVRNVRNFTAFLGRSPDTATSDDLRRFQLHMAQQQVSPWSINAAIAALRFFFKVTLERPDLVRHLTTVQEPRKAPIVLNQEEVARLLEAAPGLKYKAALSVAYGAGLRVSEVANLKVSDIDSERMTLRVEQGKGQRDRYVMLSPQLLELLRDWWHAARPRAWLFPGQNPINPVTARQLNRAVTAAKTLACISKRVSPHTLRHYVALRTMSHAFDYRPVFWRKPSVARDIVSLLLSTCIGEGVDHEVYRQRSDGFVTRAGGTSGALHCLIFEVGDRTGIRAVFAAGSDSDRC